MIRRTAQTERLRDHLGAPASESGVELLILDRLFTEEEASLALQVPKVPALARNIADSAGIAAAKTARLLESMATKGLIVGTRTQEGTSYHLHRAVVLLWDTHFWRGPAGLSAGDEELARLFRQYFSETLEGHLYNTASPSRRVFALEDALPSDAPETDRVSSFVSSADFWSVGHCTCRVQTGLRHTGCEAPTEVCLIFGSFARYLASRNIARAVSAEEAGEIQRAAGERRLVITANDSMEAGWICNCCSCCCITLEAARDLGPRKVLCPSPYQAVPCLEACAGCGLCEDTCAFQAAHVGDRGVVEIDDQACVGCGACVVECPEGALRLERRSPAESHVPPAAKPTQ